MSRVRVGAAIGVCLSCWCLAASSAQGADFDVVVRNDFRASVRFVRVDDSQRAELDVGPGGREGPMQLRSNSEQVFMAFIGGRLAGSPVVFDPRNAGGVTLTVTAQGELIPALKPRP